MPHMLILAMGSSGDVHPMIALAKQLRARGHEVTFAVNPHFFPLLEKLAIPTAPIGTEEEYRRATAAPELWQPTKAFPFILKKLILPLMEPVYRLVAELRPTVVIGTPLSLGARAAHEALGVPYATVVLAPSPILCVDHAPRLPPLSPNQPRWLNRFWIWLINRYLDRLVGPEVNAFRRDVGLGAVKQIVTRYWHSPQLVLGLFPACFLGHPIPQDWPATTRLTGFPLYDEADVMPEDPAVEAFLQAGPPPVVFTPGSAMRQGYDFFLASATAIHQLKARAIFLTRHREQLPAHLPAGIAYFPFVPLSRLLPRCAALVSHGGIGTVAQGLASGIPQLVMPMAHDQPDNAARLVALEAGLALPRRRYQASAVARALRDLAMEPRYRAGAQALAACVRESSAGAIERACEEVEGLSAEDGKPKRERPSIG